MGDVELSELQHSCLEGDAREEAKLSGGDSNGVLHVVDVEFRGKSVRASVFERRRWQHHWRVQVKIIYKPTKLPLHKNFILSVPYL